MYAISERNIKLAALVFGLGMIHVCANAVSTPIVPANVTKKLLQYTNNLGHFVPLPPPLSGCVHISDPMVHPSAILYVYFLFYRIVRVASSQALTPRYENLPYTATYRVAVYLGTACTLLPELILQVYTWRKTLKIRRKPRSQDMDDSLFALLLRGGAWDNNRYCVSFLITNTQVLSVICKSITLVPALVISALEDL